jgi:hypothetical protein
MYKSNCNNYEEKLNFFIFGLEESLDYCKKDDAGPIENCKLKPNWSPIYNYPTPPPGAPQHSVFINVFKCRHLPLFSGTEKVYMQVQGQKNIKMFCKDYVERAEVYLYFSTCVVLLRAVGCWNHFVPQIPSLICYKLFL